MILRTENELHDLRQNKGDKIIVLCHGCFDVFHYGHLVYLKESKNMGDILVVSLTGDNFIKKEVGRPIFDILKRLSIVDELKCVDYTYVSEDYTSVRVIQNLKPNIYSKATDVKGKELDPKENLFYEKKMLENIRGKLVFIEMVPEISSTNIINGLK